MTLLPLIATHSLDETTFLTALETCLIRTSPRMKHPIRPMSHVPPCMIKETAVTEAMTMILMTNEMNSAMDENLKTDGRDKEAAVAAARHRAAATALQILRGHPDTSRLDG